MVIKCMSVVVVLSSIAARAALGCDVRAAQRTKNTFSEKEAVCRQKPRIQPSRGTQCGFGVTETGVSPAEGMIQSRMATESAPDRWN